MQIIKYYSERTYPYIFFLLSTIFFYWKGFNFSENNNMNNAIDGVNTITALIIGFLGAILPVILGMKNESKFAQYVFENDRNKLFLKYIRENILVGLVLIVISICLYFRDEIVLKEYSGKIFYVWVSLIILFLVVTYRCLSHMLSLIFSSDKDLKRDLYDLSEEEKKEIEDVQNNFSGSKNIF